MHTLRKTFPAVIRIAHEGDRNFIFDSWRRSYRSAPANRLTPDLVYTRNQIQTINRLLNRSHSLVASFPHETDLIVGYVVYELRRDHILVHYLYTKDGYRRRRVATQLLNALKAHRPDATMLCSHATAADAFPAIVKSFNIEYDPQLQD